MIGIIAALVILLLMFGSVVAAGLPDRRSPWPGSAWAGRGHRARGPMDVSPTAPTVAAMVGLGVGIDYALLMLTRLLEHLAPARTSSTPPAAPPPPRAARSCWPAPPCWSR